MSSAFTYFFPNGGKGTTQSTGFLEDNNGGFLVYVVCLKRSGLCEALGTSPLSVPCWVAAQEVCAPPGLCCSVPLQPSYM